MKERTKDEESDGGEYQHIDSNTLFLDCDFTREPMSDVRDWQDEGPRAQNTHCASHSDADSIIKVRREEEHGAHDDEDEDEDDDDDDLRRDACGAHRQQEHLASGCKSYYCQNHACTPIYPSHHQEQSTLHHHRIGVIFIDEMEMCSRSGRI